MFDSLRSKLGLIAARFVFRNETDTVQPMTNFFTGAKNVLVVLPVGYDDAIVAGEALRKFRDRIPDVHLTVVHNSTRHTSLIDFLHCEVIRIDPPDINWFFLPRQNLLGRIPKRAYDAALDLNLDFVLHSAYICKASGARVRVGFAHPAGDSFFNVQLQFAGPRTAQALFTKYAGVLGMF